MDKNIQLSRDTRAVHVYYLCMSSVHYFTSSVRVSACVCVCVSVRACVRVSASPSDRAMVDEKFTRSVFLLPSFRKCGQRMAVVLRGDATAEGLPHHAEFERTSVAHEAQLPDSHGVDRQCITT